ncbi:MAG: hypothetical protein KF745_03610 [Phycisphaeraceae bacterium]|nr:hypothetical protein [Phycisphaeraceae bacterium]
MVGGHHIPSPRTPSGSAAAWLAVAILAIASAIAPAPPIEPAPLGSTPQSPALGPEPRVFTSSVLGVSLQYPGSWPRFYGTCTSVDSSYHPRAGPATNDTNHWILSIYPPEDAPAPHPGAEPRCTLNLSVVESPSPSARRYLAEHNNNILLTTDFEFADGRRGKRFLAPDSSHVIYLLEAFPDRLIVISAYSVAPSRLPDVDAIAATARAFPVVRERPTPGVWKTFRGEDAHFDYPGEWLRSASLDDEKPSGRLISPPLLPSRPGIRPQPRPSLFFGSSSIGVPDNQSITPEQLIAIPDFWRATNEYEIDARPFTNARGQQGLRIDRTRIPKAGRAPVTSSEAIFIFHVKDGTLRVLTVRTTPNEPPNLVPRIEQSFEFDE